jgi:hypothetical protein
VSSTTSLRRLKRIFERAGSLTVAVLKGAGSLTVAVLKGAGSLTVAVLKGAGSLTVAVLKGAVKFAGADDFRGAGQINRIVPSKLK